MERQLSGRAKQCLEFSPYWKKQFKITLRFRLLVKQEQEKEVVARSIHYNSNRSKEAFVAVNMGAIPRDLLESELFGYEKGAFTGAVARKKGRFELAHKGTLFLDEIAEMDINLQAKVLRAIQEREIYEGRRGAAYKI